MSDMAVCSICGKEYRACLSCKEKMKIMPWKRLTDTEECYKIFLTLQSYTNKNTTKEEARSALEKVKFNKEELKPHIQAAIDEIFAKDPEEDESAKQDEVTVPDGDESPKEKVPEGDKSPNEDKSLEEEKVPEEDKSSKDGENKVANKPQQSQQTQTQPKSQGAQPSVQKAQTPPKESQPKQAQPKKSSKYYKKGKKR